MTKTQQRLWRQGDFGADLALEFFAPPFNLSAENQQGLRMFFRVLVPLIGMEVLPTPIACRVIAWLESLGLASRWLFSLFIQWLKDPRMYWVMGRGSQLDGMTVIQVIQTSEISLHTWPGLSYARLNVSTCAPQKLSPDKVIELLEMYLSAEVYHYELTPWQGPRGKDQCKL